MPGSRPPRDAEGRPRDQGVTLVELVLVILLLGILAVFVLPRLFDLGAFSARGAYETTEAALRYARKEAYASECPVTVSLTKGVLTLTQQAGCTSGRSIPVLSPSGNGPYTFVPPSGTSLVFNPAGSIVFDALGGVSGPTTVEVSGGGFTGIVTVHAPSGFVSGSP